MKYEFLEGEIYERLQGWGVIFLVLERAILDRGRLRLRIFPLGYTGECREDFPLTKKMTMLVYQGYESIGYRKIA